MAIEWVDQLVQERVGSAPEWAIGLIAELPLQIPRARPVLLVLLLLADEIPGPATSAPFVQPRPSLHSLALAVRMPPKSPA